MQDFTGVPCIVDLATMREAVGDLGGDPDKVNPLAPADLVIDHSVIADLFGTADAFERNVEIEYQRNGERYQFLRWGQGAFDDFKVVPPGTGIVHQVNIEYLARVVMIARRGGLPRHLRGHRLAHHDGQRPRRTRLGRGRHRGRGRHARPAGVDADPPCRRLQADREIQPAVTATDVVLTVTEMLRKHGVVGKFVEFYGEVVAEVPLANRATLGNMSPEFGSTAAIFPIDEETISYLRFTGRSDEQLALVEAYAKEQGMWHDPEHEPAFSEYLELDLSDVVPSIAGPEAAAGPNRVVGAKSTFRKTIPSYVGDDPDKQEYSKLDEEIDETFPASDPGWPTGTPTTRPRVQSAAAHSKGRVSNPVTVKSEEHGEFVLDHGAVVIAAITSCTNTSNPG